MYLFLLFVKYDKHYFSSSVRCSRHTRSKVNPVFRLEHRSLSKHVKRYGHDFLKINRPNCCSGSDLQVTCACILISTCQVSNLKTPITATHFARLLIASLEGNHGQQEGKLFLVKKGKLKLSPDLFFLNYSSASPDSQSV